MPGPRAISSRTPHERPGRHRPRRRPAHPGPLDHGPQPRHPAPGRHLRPRLHPALQRAGTPGLGAGRRVPDRRVRGRGPDREPDRQQLGPRGGLLRLRQGRARPGPAVLAALTPGTRHPAGTRRTPAAAGRGRARRARRGGVRAAAAPALGPGGVEKSVPPPTRVHPAAPQPLDGSAAPRREVRDDDALLMIFTSGTEGASKAAVLTHANCFWNNLSLSRTLDMGSNDVVLAVLPQFHVGGWNIQPLLAWWTGATVVLERGFDPGRVLQLIAERG